MCIDAIIRSIPAILSIDLYVIFPPICAIIVIIPILLDLLYLFSPILNQGGIEKYKCL
jgi:hypothetical protein